MAQFDVYINPNKRSGTLYPYLVDIQSSVLASLTTRIVIPLGLRSAFRNQAMRGLTPELHFAGQALLLLTPQLSSISARQLGQAVGSLSQFREQIVAALDFAVSGF